MPRTDTLRAETQFHEPRRSAARRSAMPRAETQRHEPTLGEAKRSATSGSATPRAEARCHAPKRSAATAAGFAPLALSPVAAAREFRWAAALERLREARSDHCWRHSRAARAGHNDFLRFVLPARPGAEIPNSAGCKAKRSRSGRDKSARPRGAAQDQAQSRQEGALTQSPAPACSLALARCKRLFWSRFFSSLSQELATKVQGAWESRRQQRNFKRRAQVAVTITTAAAKISALSTRVFETTPLH